MAVCRARGDFVPIVISLTLACLFVFLAGFNVWNMLTNRGTSPRSGRLWARVHRVAGYAFIALFVIFCYFMLLRVKGQADELSSRLILHVALALLLAPLLLVKVIVARYQKAARGLLTALGIGIFAAAFTLVSLNLVVHFLRAASTDKVPARTSLTLVVVVLISVAIAFFAKTKQPKAKADTGVLSLSKPAAQEPSNRDEPLHLTLGRIESQTQDAKTLRFLLPKGQRIAARPGQFLTFEWTIDGKPVSRSYSICSSPTHGNFIEITAKRVENGYVSQFLNDRAKAGLTVNARGPYGRFCFDESKHQRIVLIAGGSGITPMMAMLRYIDDLCIPVDATLVYCVRSEQDVFFKSELAALQSRLSRFRCVLVLSQPSSDWGGWKGRLQREVFESEIDKPLESTFFLCGPSAFMELAKTLLQEMAVDPARILQESFGGAVAGEKHSVPSTGLLTVRFARSAVAYTMSPDETLLEGSERNGVLIPSGCRLGSCGTCTTKLLSGKVKMEQEEALNDELRSLGYILPCVSRALTDITLDA
jgi:ferredoxin-NADP reductase